MRNITKPDLPRIMLGLGIPVMTLAGVLAVNPAVSQGGMGVGAAFVRVLVFLVAAVGLIAILHFLDKKNL